MGAPEIAEYEWAPFPDSGQMDFLRCPYWEVLFHGTRGPGKTDAMLMDFAQHTGQGYGEAWRGVLFRNTYKQLKDVIAKTKKWFNLIFPEASWNGSEHVWTWPTGEKLYLSYMDKPADYWNYHGHEYCVPFGEVLTEQGWKAIEEVLVGQKVYSMTKERKLQKKEVTDVYKNWYEGPMIERNGRGIHMEFTPKHRLPSLGHHPTDEQDFELKKYDEIGSQFFSVRGGANWEGKKLDVFVVDKVSDPERFERSKQPDEISGDKFCKLMGWFISEGHVVSGHSLTSISQEKEKNCQKIKRLLNECGFNWDYKSGEFQIYGRKWSQFFKKLGIDSSEKELPKWFLGLEKDLLNSFLETALLGDGIINNGIEYYTKSKKLSDQMQEIGIKLGYETYVSTKNCNGDKFYTVHFHKTKHGAAKLQKGEGYGNCEKKQYQGEIYCIQVKDNENFLIRQNGSTWLSGNSWIGWEELTNWASPECYDMMKACSRSTEPDMPRKYRATCNPYGPGHNWIKLRFIDQAEHKEPIEDENGNKRCHIFGHWTENKFLVENDPEYIERLQSISDENKRKAWLEGSWDIVAGGMFDDVWEEETHVIPQPELHGDWEIFISLDWGSSAPFSVGWNAKAGRGASIEYENDRGETIEKEIPEDSIIRMNEWYGWNGEPNTGIKLSAREVAQGINERTKKSEYPKPTTEGVADYSIWNVDNENSIYSHFDAMDVIFSKEGSKEVKGSNSRIPGWERMRQMLKNGQDTPWENPVLLVTRECKQFCRTVPTLPRDESKMDDVDTDAEDHIGDEQRYACLFDPKSKGSKTVSTGAY